MPVYPIRGMENWRNGDLYRMDYHRTSNLIVIIRDMNYINGNGIPSLTYLIPYVGIIDSSSKNVQKYLRKNPIDGCGVILQFPLTPELIKASTFYLVESYEDDKEDAELISPFKMEIVEKGTCLKS